MKQVGLIIKFDDKEYSNEERDLLWGRFILLLAETAQEIKENKNAKCTHFSKEHAAKNIGLC